MSLAAPTDAPRTDPAATARALVEQQLAMLTRLAEIGMEIAEAAGLRARVLADGGEAGADAADPGLTFSRAARAVRLTLALQSRLAEGLAALHRAEALARVGEAHRRRNRIHDRVEAAAEAEHRDPVEIERLSSETWERLDEAEDDDLLALPVEEIVARICRDLGLCPTFAAPAFGAAPSPAPAAGPLIPTGTGFAPAPAGAAVEPGLARWRAPPIPAAAGCAASAWPAASGAAERLRSPPARDRPIRDG